MLLETKWFDKSALMISKWTIDETASIGSICRFFAWIELDSVRTGVIGRDPGLGAFEDLYTTSCDSAW